MITIKNCLKSVGVSIVIFCSSFLTFLFQNYRLDLIKIDASTLDSSERALYDATIVQSNLMLAISGGVLTLFAVVTLFFSISRFISDNQANMGILKALGYKKKEIAFQFCKFSLNVLLGSVIAFLAFLAFSSIFYQEMNKDRVLPEVTFSIHIGLTLIAIFVPFILFSGISYLIAYIKLGAKPLSMIKGEVNKKSRKTKEKSTFIKTLKSSILFSHISLILFVGFAALCFGASVQMSFSMNQLGTSPLFFWLMFGIGFLLGVSILYLAFTFTFNGNKKYVVLLKAYGYSSKEIIATLYGGYTIITIIGFVVGTFYQYGLIKIMVGIFSKSTPLTYTYSFPGLGYTLLIFVPLYLLLHFWFFRRVNHLSLKETLS